MEFNIIIEQINEIIEYNTQITELQKTALKEAQKYIKPGMSVQDIIEVLKILGAILTLSHSN